MIKELAKIHQSMLLVLLVLLVVAVYLVMSNTMMPAFRNLDQVLQIVAIVIAGFCFWFGNRQVNQQLQKIRADENSVEQKVLLYKKASLLQWRLLVAASVFSTTCFLVAGNLAYVFLAGSLLIYLALLGPGAAKLAILLKEDVSAIKAV